MTKIDDDGPIDFLVGEWGERPDDLLADLDRCVRDLKAHLATAADVAPAEWAQRMPAPLVERFRTLEGIVRDLRDWD